MQSGRADIGLGINRIYWNIDRIIRSPRIYSRRDTIPARNFAIILGAAVYQTRYLFFSLAAGVHAFWNTRELTDRCEPDSCVLYALDARRIMLNAYITERDRQAAHVPPDDALIHRLRYARTSTPLYTHTYTHFSLRTHSSFSLECESERMCKCTRLLRHNGAFETMLGLSLSLTFPLFIIPVAFGKNA